MSIADNISRVREQITSACARSARDPASVTLVAVSKTHPAQAVLEAIAAGVQHFGENRVEESEQKIPAVRDMSDAAITWHMIGHIQSRKAKEVPPLFQVVHSVDTFKLAARLSGLMAERGGQLDILIEVNVSGEESKSGFHAYGWEHSPERLDQLVVDFQAMLDLPGVRVRGLMTMAPIVENAEAARPVFASLAALRDRLSELIGSPLPELSMGMTDDYSVAIEEGATLIRVGRAIFGERTG
jgi:PLP dependent protein